MPHPYRSQAVPVTDERRNRLSGIEGGWLVVVILHVFRTFLPRPLPSSRSGWKTFFLYFLYLNLQMYVKLSARTPRRCVVTPPPPASIPFESATTLSATEAGDCFGCIAYQVVFRCVRRQQRAYTSRKVCRFRAAALPTHTHTPLSIHFQSG